ncbi:histidine phosphatase family protein [Allokutzneria multivorans]|uniref:Histidine phosphatase family protein n=1 Tax=Allokutzneria multivorans TaxID=1142134 RepID=A0ABP7QRB8_9PSEU
MLVRHAESEIPRPGGPDEYHRPLTATGLAQAASLVLPRPTRVVSSPYLRAVQTVAPLGLPVDTVHELREWDSGLQPSPDYARHYAASWADPEMARPGGESLAQLTSRAVAALTALADGGVVVVGSHGTFVARALAGFGVSTVDWPFSAAMPMPAVYRIRFSAGHPHVSGPGLGGDAA